MFDEYAYISFKQHVQVMLHFLHLALSIVSTKGVEYLEDVFSEIFRIVFQA